MQGSLRRATQVLAVLLAMAAVAAAGGCSRPSGPADIDALVRDAQSGSPAKVVSAVEGLVAIGKPALPAVNAARRRVLRSIAAESERRTDRVLLGGPMDDSPFPAGLVEADVALEQVQRRIGANSSSPK